MWHIVAEAPRKDVGDCRADNPMTKTSCKRRDIKRASPAAAVLFLLAVAGSANAGPTESDRPTESGLAVTSVAPAMGAGGQGKRVEHLAPIGEPKTICQLLEAAAAANGLPLEFFARVIWQESRF